MSYNVLFLCTANSARSIIAESILNREGVGKFTGYSAGSNPSGSVDPRAINLLQQMNHSTEELRSKSWDEFSGADAPEMHFVFTVCDNLASETCPVWPGQPLSAHWGLPDPASATGTEAEIATAYADTYRMLTNRISIFVNLPIESIDKLALQERLDGIGTPA